jgi:hypothetical protein
MRHLGAKSLSHLKEHTTGAKIEKSTKPLTPYEACAMSKATEIVSQRIGKTLVVDEPIARVAYCYGTSLAGLPMMIIIMISCFQRILRLEDLAKKD